MRGTHRIHDPEVFAAKGPADLVDAGADQIEAVQLQRLASTVLSKSPADLAALAEDNPLLFWEWIEEFHRRKAKADAEVRLWSAAIACLATSSPSSLPVAAE